MLDAVLSPAPAGNTSRDSKDRGISRDEDAESQKTATMEAVLQLPNCTLAAIRGVRRARLMGLQIPRHASTCTQSRRLDGDLTQHSRSPPLVFVADDRALLARQRRPALGGHLHLQPLLQHHLGVEEVLQERARQADGLAVTQADRDLRGGGRGPWRWWRRVLGPMPGSWMPALWHRLSPPGPARAHP